VHERRATLVGRRGEVGDALLVDRRRSRPLALGAVDVGVGGAVEDVGEALAPGEGRDRGGVGDIDLVAAGGDAGDPEVIEHPAPSPCRGCPDRQPRQSRSSLGDE